MELKKFGMDINFPPLKLKQGYGEIVCTVLNDLLDKVLKNLDFKFMSPEYPPGGRTDGFDDDDDEDEGVGDGQEEEDGEEVQDDVANESEDEEEYYMDERNRGRKDSGDRAENKLIESEIDPEKWRLEMERVGPQLTKLKLQVDGKDWRTHVEQMKSLQETIQKTLPDVDGQLRRISDDIAKVSDKIKRREAMISSHFESLVWDINFLSARSPRF